MKIAVVALVSSGDAADTFISMQVFAGYWLFRTARTAVNSHYFHTEANHTMYPSKPKKEALLYT